MRIIALSLSSLLVAHVASSQGPGSLALENEASPRSFHHVASVGAALTPIEGSLHRTGPGESGWAIAHGALDTYSGRLGISPTLELSTQLFAARLAHPETSGFGSPTGTTASVSFRHSTGDAYLAIRAPSGDFQAPVQLLAAFGLRKYSFRVSSWRRLGQGPSVHAGALRVVRNVKLFQTGADGGVGLSVTMYRLGSRFDHIYRRRPVSVHALFRIRFGGNAGGAAFW